MASQVGGMRDPTLLKQTDINNLCELAEVLNSIVEQILEISAENSLSQAGLTAKSASVEMIPSSHSSSVEMIPSSHSSSEKRKVTKKEPITIHRSKKQSYTETSLGGGGRKSKKASSSASVKLQNTLDEEITNKLLTLLSKNTMTFQKDTRGRTSSLTLREYMVALKVHTAFLTMATGNTKFLENNLANTQKAYKIKQSNLNEKNMGQLIKKLLNFNEQNLILINRTFHLKPTADFGKTDNAYKGLNEMAAKRHSKWAQELYKLPTKTSCGFIRYGENYAITTPKLIIVLNQTLISVENGKKFFNMCYLDIVQNTQTIEELKAYHKESINTYDKIVKAKSASLASSAESWDQLKKARFKVPGAPPGAPPGPYELVGLSDLNSTNNSSTNSSNSIKSGSQVSYLVPAVAQPKPAHLGPIMRVPSVVESTSSNSSNIVSYASVNHGNGNANAKSKSDGYRTVAPANSASKSKHRATQKMVRVKVEPGFFGSNFETNSIETKKKNRLKKTSVSSSPQFNISNNGFLDTPPIPPKIKSKPIPPLKPKKTGITKTNTGMLSISGNSLDLNEEITKLIGGKLTANDEHGTFTLTKDFATKKLLFEYRFKAFTFDQKVATTDLESKLAIAIRKVDKSKQISVFTLKGPGKQKIQFKINRNKLELVESSVAGKKKSKKKAKPKVEACTKTTKKEPSRKGKN
jgi:hypothetical protein